MNWFSKLFPKKQPLAPISRSEFKTGCRCEMEFWADTHLDLEKISSESYSPISNRDKEELRYLASLQFENCKDASFSYTKTLYFLKEGFPVMNAQFRGKYLRARIDFVLPRENQGIVLYQLKASLSAKKSYYEDASFNWMAAESCGFEVEGCHLLLIRSKYKYSESVDPEELFLNRDIFSDAKRLLPATKKKVKKLLQLRESEKPPILNKVEHCSHPKFCSYPEFCYPDRKIGDIFTLREGKDISHQHFLEGKDFVSQIEDLEPLTEKQRIQVQSLKEGAHYVDEENIRTFLDSLNYPIYYLDFETINPPVPLFPGTTPFQHIPFQFSLHVQVSTEVELEHKGFLQKEEGDPRPKVLELLREWIQPGGSVVCFNDRFEKRCLKDSVDVFPEFADWFQSIEPNFVDLAKPFWDFHYYHPEQLGSTSLKRVLPVLTGETYDTLSIHSGKMANQEYLRIYKEEVSLEEKSRIYEYLEEYCKLDTLALHMILEKFRELVSAF